MSAFWSYLTTTDTSSTSAIIFYGMVMGAVLALGSWTSWWWQRWIAARYWVVLMAVLPVMTVSAPLVVLALFLRFEAISPFTMRIWFYSIVVISLVIVVWRLRPVKKQLVEQANENDRYMRYDRYLPKARHRS